QRISETTEVIINFLSAHPKIEKIYFPFLPSFPQYSLAKRQMKGCGGLFTITFKAQNAGEIEDFCNALKYFSLAVSWGGHESLVSPWVAGINKNDFDPANETHRQIRFYIGLEDADVLLDDLRQAFKK